MRSSCVAQGAPDGAADGRPTPGGATAASLLQLLDATRAPGRPRPLVMVQWEIAQVLWDESVLFTLAHSQTRAVTCCRCSRSPY